MDLVTESAPVVFHIQNIIDSVKSNNGNEVEKKVENKVEEHGEKMDVEITVGDEKNKEKEKEVTGNNKEEIRRVISLKDLSNLTNTVTLFYSKNTDFILFRDILNSLIQYQMAIMSWSEKAQLLLPIQSTRSKMGKDMKSTKISDLESVKLHTDILFFFKLPSFVSQMIRFFARFLLSFGKIFTS